MRVNLPLTILVAAGIAIINCGSADAAKTKQKSSQPPGGANEVQGTRGKLGQLLFTGKWRFQAIRVNPASPTYILKTPRSEQDYAKYHDVADFDDNSHTFTAKQGYTFITVDCYAKNGQPKVEQLDFFSDAQNTAITDNQSNGYPPIAIDMITKGVWVTKNLLQGSGETITFVFAVPEGTTPQDLIVTLKNWEDHKGKDVRISLGS